MEKKIKGTNITDLGDGYIRMPKVDYNGVVTRYKTARQALAEAEKQMGLLKAAAEKGQLAAAASHTGTGPTPPGNINEVP